ncbi:hypothetical protein BRARA_B02442 [Brassica rapa]|uniref:SWIM-type domain-containing protein n=1 Tax=Brassica campestris TaxID=3711 RepID=A0A398AD38_BRACM|nr:hypothetical protein BRARA_B02442 [Brassica rapa]
MGHLVRVVVGDWQRLAHGTWRFDINHVDVKYDLVLKENETYEELVAMVRGEYPIHHTEPVALTYDFPEWMKVPGDYTTPPVDILDDKDVELFMAVRMDFANLTLCVTYENVDVVRYSQMWREEFGLTEDGTDVVPPKPIPWRAVSRWWKYEGVEIRRTAVRLTKREILHPLEVVDEVSSESDSSDEMEVFTPDAEGMIRLEEVPTEQQSDAGLTLGIAINNDVAYGSTDKGKGIMTELGMGGGPMFSLQMWSGSGDASEDADQNPEGAYAGHDVNAGDEGKEKSYISSKLPNHVSVNIKSEPGKVVLECSGVNCQWRVYAAKLAGCARFEIKTLESSHQCTVDEREEFKRHATASVVGGIMRSKYVGTGSGPRPAALREMMRMNHSVPISYWTACKSREIAIENWCGNAEESYSTLPSYLQHLAIANPGTTVALEANKGPGSVQRFKYLFLSFGASIKGLSFMRKVIIIDGTHLKGNFAGCLLTASAENDASWTWFFHKLTAVVPDAENLVFVSDRHTPLYLGIRRVYPAAKHCASLLHLQRNVQTIFKKKHLLYLIGKAAKVYKLEDFYLHFNEIKQIDMACADYLIRIGLEHLARSHFEGTRYNIMTSNLAESLNAALSEAREYPIISLLERDAAAKNVGYAVKHIIDNEYEVVDGQGMYYRVDLDNKTCSCKEFDALAISCAHAVSASAYGKEPVENRVDVLYSKAYWASAYSGSIKPVEQANIAVYKFGVDRGDGHLLPPATRPPPSPGRPRKARFASRGEFKVTGAFKRRRACSRCGGTDHNKVTCKMHI